MDKPSAASVNGHRIRKSLCVCITVLMATGNADYASAEQDHSAKDLDGRFSTLYEPSGIAPLPDGRFLVVEDEPKRALRLVSFETSDNDASIRETDLALPGSLTERLSIGTLDDLEGSAHDQSGRIYIVTSHDDSAPHWVSKRQKLLRFSVEDGRMHDVARSLTLRQDLLNTFPQLDANPSKKGKSESLGMNIEGLAYDRRRDVLLIGFRSPVLEGNAIIVSLMNPDAYLSGNASPVLSKSLWSVALDKGGLRAMSYDDASDQLLLVSRRENHKNDDYKLWRLAADGKTPAMQIELGDKEKMMQNVEGLAPITLDSQAHPALLLVRDNGNRKKGQGGKWFIVSRTELGLDADLH